MFNNSTIIPRQWHGVTPMLVAPKTQTYFPVGNVKHNEAVWQYDYAFLRTYRLDPTATFAEGFTPLCLPTITAKKSEVNDFLDKVAVKTRITKSCIEGTLLYEIKPECMRLPEDYIRSSIIADNESGSNNFDTNLNNLDAEDSGSDSGLSNSGSTIDLRPLSTEPRHQKLASIQRNLPPKTTFDPDCMIELTYCATLEHHGQLHCKNPYVFEANTNHCQAIRISNIENDQPLYVRCAIVKNGEPIPGKEAVIIRFQLSVFQTPYRTVRKPDKVQATFYCDHDQIPFEEGMRLYKINDKVSNTVDVFMKCQEIARKSRLLVLEKTLVRGNLEQPYGISILARNVASVQMLPMVMDELIRNPNIHILRVQIVFMEEKSQKVAKPTGLRLFAQFEDHGSFSCFMTMIQRPMYKETIGRRTTQAFYKLSKLAISISRNLDILLKMGFALLLDHPLFDRWTVPMDLKKGKTALQVESYFAIQSGYFPATEPYVEDANHLDLALKYRLQWLQSPEETLFAERCASNLKETIRLIRDDGDEEEKATEDLQIRLNLVKNFAQYHDLQLTHMAPYGSLAQIWQRLYEINRAAIDAKTEDNCIPGNKQGRVLMKKLQDSEQKAIAREEKTDKRFNFILDKTLKEYKYLKLDNACMMEESEMLLAFEKFGIPPDQQEKLALLLDEIKHLEEFEFAKRHKKEMQKRDRKKKMNEDSRPTITTTNAQKQKRTQQTTNNKKHSDGKKKSRRNNKKDMRQKGNKQQKKNTRSNRKKTKKAGKKNQKRREKTLGYHMNFPCCVQALAPFKRQIILKEAAI